MTISSNGLSRTKVPLSIEFKPADSVFTWASFAFSVFLALQPTVPPDVNSSGYARVIAIVPSNILALQNFCFLTTQFELQLIRGILAETFPHKYVEGTGLVMWELIQRWDLLYVGRMDQQQRRQVKVRSCLGLPETWEYWIPKIRLYLEAVWNAKDSNGEGKESGSDLHSKDDVTYVVF